MHLPVLIHELFFYIGCKKNASFSYFLLHSAQKLHSIHKFWHKNVDLHISTLVELIKKDCSN